MAHYPLQLKQSFGNVLKSRQITKTSKINTYTQISCCVFITNTIVAISMVLALKTWECQFPNASANAQLQTPLLLRPLQSGVNVTVLCAIRAVPDPHSATLTWEIPNTFRTDFNRC